jgi:probable HAF family extracellular repeat protein
VGHNNKTRVAAAYAFLGLTAFAAQSVWTYKFFPAGNFPGTLYTIPLAMSLDHIVGYDAAPTANNAYVQKGTSFVNAAPLGSTSSYLSGINRLGVGAGGYCTTKGGCNPEAGEHGYTFDSRSGRVRGINFPMSGAATTAYGINDFGVVVGGYCPNAVSCPQGLFSPASDGFIEDKGVFATLDFPGAQATSACAINNAGTIVGFYVINNTGPHAFLYQNGSFISIDFPGSGYTIATSINNLGAVAGLFSSSTGLHGFIYYNGSFTQIDRPNATGTGLTGINDRNELVGTWYPTTSVKNFKATPVAPLGQP